jgi:hypothetical protein
MLKSLTNLLLILAIGSSVVAGMPVHSGGSDSGMMDCCKKALEQNDSPHVAAARLCCAMNCNEPTSTNGNTSQSFSQTISPPSPLIGLALPPAANLKPLRARYTPTWSTGLKPAYILNLALLI